MQELFNEHGLEATKNSYGYMHKMSPIGHAFIDFAKMQHAKPMLDIGCAYGVTTIPCLQSGAQVIACDLEEQHLTELRPLKQIKRHLLFLNVF